MTNAPALLKTFVANMLLAKAAVRLSLLVLVALVLSACGFHLRNALALPGDLGPVRVSSPDPYSPLAQSLSQALGRAGATPAADGATDAATLQIVSERWANSPLSVDQAGRAQEYSLRYAVIFRLRRADGTDLVPQQVIELSRDYISVPTNSSGTEGEQEILGRELRRDMVSSILLRIDAASRAPGHHAGMAPTSSSPDSTVPAPPTP
jgi:LPS-assembly lipoprotein